MKNIISSILLLSLVGLSLMPAKASAMQPIAAVPAPTSVNKAKPMVCREYACGSFTDLSLTLSYATIKVIEGQKPRVVVRASQKYLDHLKLRVSNGVLYIQSDKSRSHSMGEAEIFIYKKGQGSYTYNGKGCSLSVNSATDDLSSYAALTPSESYPVESTGSIGDDNVVSSEVTTVTTMHAGEAPTTIIRRSGTPSTNTVTITTDNDVDDLYSYAQGSRETVVRSLSLGTFTGIKCYGSAVVHFTQGKECAVRVKGTEAEIASKEVKVDNGTLVIRNKKQTQSGQEHFEVFVTAPSLTSINIAGTCTFTSEAITTPHLALEIAGVGSVKLDKVCCDDTRLDVSGVSTVTAEVSGDKLRVQSNGASTVNMSFKGSKATINNSGVGAVKLHTDCDTLTATNSGTANVTLTGTADHTEIHASGVSQIDTSGLNNY